MTRALRATLRRRVIRQASTCLSLGLLLACPPTPPATPDAGALDASRMDGSGVDSSVLDVAPGDAAGADALREDAWTDPCPAGTLGCACTPGDSCDDPLQCVLDECRDCERGALDCRCLDNNACLVGAVCRADNVCVPCTRGSEACFCQDDGSCDGGLACQQGVCVIETCVPGSEGCACDQGSCAADLYCGGSGTCLACSSDVIGCACEGSACSNGLVCDPQSVLCRAPLACDELSCLPHQLCEHRAHADAVCVEDCESGYRWDSGTGQCEIIHSSCDPGTADSILDSCEALHMHCVSAGDLAACIGCQAGFVLADSADPTAGCRAVVDCDTLGCAASDRSCVPATDSSDAHCGDCLPPLVEGDAGGCVANPAANCNAGNDPDSILAQCTTAHRNCDDSGTGARCSDCISPFVESPYSGLCERTDDCSRLGCDTWHRACTDFADGHCTTCLPGYVDAGGTCRPVLTFAEVSCDAGTQFKVHETSTQDAHCITKPCPDGQASNGATCVTSCPASCSGTGKTGRLWPHTLQNGRCICESADGYYFDTTALSQQPCDGDDDGWTRLGARSALRSTDAELKANARCDLRQIDRYKLLNEFGQFKTVVSCSVGAETFRGPFDPTCEDETLPIDLYEVNYLDDDEALAVQGPDPYGIGARRLGARELNSLTKACSAPNDDFNGNELADVGEWSGSTFTFTDQAKRDALSPFLGFTYFLEVNQGHFEASPYGPIGTWVVAERPRCSNDLPLKYKVAEGTYWQGCMRNRAARFDSESGASLAGLDFARYSCAATTGSCDVPSPVLGATVPGAEREHDLCAVSVPSDGWLGMDHHSQFQCVQVTAQAPSDPAATPYEHALGDLYNGSSGNWQFNRCDATSSTSQGNANASDPGFSCSAVYRGSVVEADVGFAALRYQNDSPASAYQAGCLNECASWLDICPGYTSNPNTNDASCHPDLANFGEIVCGHCAHEGQSCDTGQAGVCAAGTYVCTNDVESCVRNTSPTTGDALGDGVDRNCDGFDGVLSGAYVYVAPSGNDSNSGLAYDRPKKSLQAAIDAANTQNLDVIAYDGTYYLTSGPVTLGAGVSMTGGYTTSNCAATQVLCLKSSGVAIVLVPNTTAVTATNITSSTTIQYFNFVAQDAQGNTGKQGKSSYGLVATGCSSNLQFTSCAFVAGKGTPGLAGTGYPAGNANHVAQAGWVGSQGFPGIQGDGRPGGMGGIAVPCEVGGHTGQGGWGGNSVKGNNTGYDGNVGLSPSGAFTGGAAGLGVAPKRGPQCPPTGAAGQPPTTPVAAASSGAPVAASFASTGYTPNVGGNGANGGNGSGGGGGGGGGGGDHNIDSSGASGGGGGAGGCGGLAGQGGGGGGASIAVYLHNASPRFTNCGFLAYGGAAGGHGGAGQVGGAGGQGGRYNLGTCYAGSAYGGAGDQDDGSMGGQGGNGGKGGDGGHGAGGAGGATLCIYKGGSSAPSLSPVPVLGTDCYLVTEAASGGTSSSPTGAGATGLRQEVYP
ncbi:MAG: hypothetical protein ABIJ09_18350 [Pseudomonadota bacterium]